MLQREVMLAGVFLVAAALLSPTQGEARPATGSGGASAGSPTQSTEQPTLYPRGTCMTGLDCATKCDSHATVYTSNGHNATMVGQCKNACATQSVPGHPGEFMAKCVEKGGRDLECVQSLVDLNLCLFQAAADPVETAKCAAALSPSCL